MKLLPADRSGPRLASFTQEERLTHGRDIHLMNNVLVFGCQVEGDLEPCRLRDALIGLRRRHEALRWVFPKTGTGTHPVDLRAVDEVDFQEFSTETDDTDEAMDTAKQLIADAAAVPFDLSQGPLIRVLCIRTAPARHLVGFVIDHVIADGASCQILADDLFTLYASGSAPAHAELPPLPFQFSDFAFSERQFLRGDELDRLMKYWRRKLAGVGTVPASLLTDPDGPPGGQPRLRVGRFTLERPLYAEFARAARQHRVTPSAVFAAALKITMRHWRRRLGASEDIASDVAIMGSLANRNHQELERAVGYFATPCVLRTDLSGAPTLAEAAQRESRTIFGALRHQELPHALMTREIDAAHYGIRHRSALGQGPRYVNFDVSGAGAAWRLDTAQLRIRITRIPRNEVPRGGIRMLVRDAGDTALVELRTDTREYSEGWAERFLQDYVDVLRQFAADPGVSLEQVPH
ncbi:condensation domain-containing protein [Streptomyces sp. NPDC126933]|uniref:condensation domain-containing protein n=1 Tax=unclassified Streptomyces TaxID=2593676 RepID=UPI003648E1AB